MPNLDTPAGKRYTGFYNDKKNDVVELYHKGVKVCQANGAALTLSGALGGATGLVAASGPITATLGDINVTAGNLRLGVVSAFATTEPTSAVVMKAGTAPSGAITTSSGIFASATVLRKIVAGGTVSDVET